MFMIMIYTWPLARSKRLRGCIRCVMEDIADGSVPFVDTNMPMTSL